MEEESSVPIGNPWLTQSHWQPSHEHGTFGSIERQLLVSGNALDRSAIVATPAVPR